MSGATNVNGIKLSVPYWAWLYLPQHGRRGPSVIVVTSHSSLCFSCSVDITVCNPSPATQNFTFQNFWPDLIHPPKGRPYQAWLHLPQHCRCGPFVIVVTSHSSLSFSPCSGDITICNPSPATRNFAFQHFCPDGEFRPQRGAGDVWWLPPVWNLRAVIWFPFPISSLVFA